MKRLAAFGTAALVAGALAFPTGAIAKHTHHHAGTAKPAADAAGAAVATAGTIATAPFGMATAYNDRYGYYGAGWNGGRWDQGYSARNGMTCTPGTSIKGDDGRRHVCQ
jgi:hypothetical protein